jgi:hypothetical protein
MFDGAALARAIVSNPGPHREFEFQQPRCQPDLARHLLDGGDHQCSCPNGRGDMLPAMSSLSTSSAAC